MYRVEAQRFLQYSEEEENVTFKPIPKKCATFERRYSEFLAVYNALMDSHRSLMEEFDGFPKKVLIGECCIRFCYCQLFYDNAFHIVMVIHTEPPEMILIYVRFKKNFFAVDLYLFFTLICDQLTISPFSSIH